MHSTGHDVQKTTNDKKSFDAGQTWRNNTGKRWYDKNTKVYTVNAGLFAGGNGTMPKPTAVVFPGHLFFLCSPLRSAPWDNAKTNSSSLPWIHIFAKNGCSWDSV